MSYYGTDANITGNMTSSGTIETTGNIQTSSQFIHYTNSDNFSTFESNSIFRKYSSTLGSGIHFTNNAILPTSYLGALNNGVISLGASNNKWDNLYAVSGIFSGDILTTDKVGIGTTTPLTALDFGNSASTQKLAIYNNGWSTGGGNGFYGFGTGSSTLLFHSNTGENGTAQMSLSSAGIITTTGDVVSNLSTINTNKTNITTNATNIGTNATNISNKVSSVAVSAPISLSGTANDPVIGFENPTAQALYTTSTVRAGNLTIGTGSITDTSGAISFGNENLTTTGYNRSNYFTVYTDADNYSEFNNNTIFRKYTATSGSGLHFTNNALLPANYLGALSNGGISFGATNYRWDNLYAKIGIFTDNVGIGTNTPLSVLDLGSTGSTQKLAIYNNSWNTGGNAGFYGFGTGNGTLLFHSNTGNGGTAQMSLNSAGNLTTSGNIQTNSDYLIYLDASNYTTMTNVGKFFRRYNGSYGAGFAFSFNSIIPTNYLGVLNESGDISLGSTSHKWKDIWSVDTSINGSDIKLKQNIEQINEIENTVASNIINGIKKYKWKQAVLSKGLTDARMHFGLIAQDVEDILINNGLNVADYGMICIDTQYSIDGKFSDDNNNIYDKDTPNTTETLSYSLRYGEIHTFLINYLHTKNTDLNTKYNDLNTKYTQLQTQYTDLETRLSILENK